MEVPASAGIPNGSIYQNLIHLTRYARLVEDGARRETWHETCTRTIDALCASPKVDADTRALLFEHLFNLEVMCSMRAMMTAGPALARENMCLYNCTFLEIDSVQAFSEVLYLLSCGTGVGFSCERRCIEKLPVIPAGELERHPEKLVVPDSGDGWALAFRTLLERLFKGQWSVVDYSLIRPEGAPLKTMGGRASGPVPLRKLFIFAKELINKARGRRLSSLEVHDLVCMVANSIVSGGVRRSALISLSDLDDDEMRTAKSGEWWKEHAYRSCANNSAVYDGRPSEALFWKEWQSLVESKSGERGIFNREAARRQAAKTGRRAHEGIAFGINPCSEIILRPRQMCNLTEVIVRAGDSFADLARKVRVATIFGTLQASFTKFNEEVLSPEWRKNGEEERLLGVSFSGIMDNALLSTTGTALEATLRRLRQVAIETNAYWAARLGIAAAASITCVKPSGTVSQLADCSAGIHPRWSPYYERRVRLDQKDPAVAFLKAELPFLELEQDAYNATQVLFSYPTKAPEGAVVATYKDADAADKSAGVGKESSSSSSSSGDDMPHSSDSRASLAGSIDGAAKLKRKRGVTVLDAENTQMPPLEGGAKLTKVAPPRTMTALEQLELWLAFSEHWCEHKPSVSIYVDDTPEEWRRVGDWVWAHFEVCSGLSFFPKNLGTYKQAPYEAITRSQYVARARHIPASVDWSRMGIYERAARSQLVSSHREALSCTAAGGCEA